jgi:hypothetical protein
MKNRCAVVLTCLLVSSVLWASSSVVPSPRSTDPRAPTGTTLGAPIPAPDPDDPLIFRVQPTEAQQGQQVLIEGFNFGSAPQVTFNGTLASIVARRLDLAALVVLVPSGAVSGALIVTNTDTAEPSNPAEFVVAPGTYTPVCSIVGTITDNTMAAVVNAEVQALDPETGLFVGLDTSDASGNYSIGLAAAGEYIDQERCELPRNAESPVRGWFSVERKARREPDSLQPRPQRASFRLAFKWRRRGQNRVGCQRRVQFLSGGRHLRFLYHRPSRG